MSSFEIVHCMPRGVLFHSRATVFRIAPDAEASQRPPATLRAFRLSQNRDYAKAAKAALGSRRKCK